MLWLCRNSVLFWAPEKARVRQPLLSVSPLLGTPENAGVMPQFRPLLGPGEGRGGGVATCDCVPFVGDPRRMEGLCSNSVLFWGPEKAELS